MQNKPRRVGTVVKLGFNILLLIVAVWVLLNRQDVLDAIQLFQYSPPAEVEALAKETSMSDGGIHAFYVSHPTLADRSTFNSSCNTNSKEQTIILGCYTGQRIYIYNITDARLPGVRQVTAAHEMLHAAYDRLGKSEKERIDAYIDAQAQKITDPRILNLIDMYRKSEPGELHNEMHSIFGTEVKELSPELEEHYKEFFTDRSKVVWFSEQYEKVFNELKAKQKSIIADMESLADEIKKRNVALSLAVKDLDSDIRSFNQRANDGDFESQAEFNTERNQLVARQQDLEADRETINQMIAAHDQKRKELEALNLEVNSLNNSLDSTPAEVPSV
jgi:hypothetical protein